MLKHFLQIVAVANFIVLLGFAPHKLQAQSSAAFIMSSVGSIPGASNTGMAIQFNSIATCLNVQNGVAVLNGVRGSGQFAINCEVTLKINSLGIKLYPNPVNTITKVKFANTPPLTETFNLTVWTTEGVLLFTRKESGYNLFQGINLDVSALGSGSYVLKIESENYLDALKFIKAN
jgi:hypothetical protein